MNFKVEIVGLVFKLINQRLCLLIVKSPGKDLTTWSLPSTLLERSKTPEEALAARIQTAGVTTSYLEQLYSFSDAEDGAIRIAYIVLADPAETNASSLGEETVWVSAKRIPRLLEAHTRIKEIGIQRLRNKVSYSRIATRLLPGEFTLTELMNVYEEILNEPIDKRNFRKKVESKKLVVPTPHFRRGVHRPARLYKQGPKAKNVPL